MITIYIYIYIKQKIKLKIHVSFYLNLINKITKDRKRLLESRRRVREIEKFNGETSVRETIDNEGDFFLFCNYANNDENVVYNDQPYFEEPIQDNQNFGLDD